MKQITILFAILLTSCVTTTQLPDQVETYYFSRTHYDYMLELVHQQKRDNAVAMIDGVQYTCRCPSSYIDSIYRMHYPDVELVAVKLKGEGVKEVYPVLIEEAR